METPHSCPSPSAACSASARQAQFITISRMPPAASARNRWPTSGCPATGSSGLGIRSVRGRMRSPRPAASTIAFKRCPPPARRAPRLKPGSEVCHVKRLSPGSLMQRLLALCFALLACAPAQAEPLCPQPTEIDLGPIDESGRIRVAADNAELTAKGDSSFTGNVSLQYRAQRLETEAARWDRESFRRVELQRVGFHHQPGLQVAGTLERHHAAEGEAIL